jgi:hypothetical protein
MSFRTSGAGSLPTCRTVLTEGGLEVGLDNTYIRIILEPQGPPLLAGLWPFGP